AVVLRRVEADPGGGQEQEDQEQDHLPIPPVGVANSTDITIPDSHSLGQGGEITAGGRSAQRVAEIPHRGGREEPGRPRPRREAAATASARLRALSRLRRFST